MSEPAKHSSKKQSKIFNLLAKLAEDVAVPINSARHAAAVIIGNEVVGLGVNSRKSDPFAAKYGRNRNSIYRHAETMAIKNALNRVGERELSQATLYVVRRKKTEQNGIMIFGNSKPCSGCQQCINAYNIKKVIWST